MDWRERKYYLVRLNDFLLFWWSKGYDNHGVKYDNHYNMIKKTIPSIKIRKPYNHFKYNDDEYGHDSFIEGIGHAQLMISCRKEYCEMFEKLC